MHKYYSGLLTPSFPAVSSLPHRCRTIHTHIGTVLLTLLIHSSALYAAGSRALHLIFTHARACTLVPHQCERGERDNGEISRETSGRSRVTSASVLRFRHAGIRWSGHTVLSADQGPPIASRISGLRSSRVLTQTSTDLHDPPGEHQGSSPSLYQKMRGKGHRDTPVQHATRSRYVQLVSLNQHHRPKPAEDFMRKALVEGI